MQDEKASHTIAGQPVLFACQQESGGSPSDAKSNADMSATSQTGGYTEQPSGTISFDGVRYRYAGFVIDSAVAGEDRYVTKSYVFTPDEALLEASCDPKRVCAMLDTVGHDRLRQREIALYGQRVWHSPYRPESAASQGLDFAFGHDVALVARALSYVEAFYQASPAEADTWTRELRRAYIAYCRWRDKQELFRVLASRGIPASELLEPQDYISYSHEL